MSTLPGFEDLPEPIPAEKLSHKERNDQLIDNGIHPRTHLPILGNGKTCGDCKMLWQKFAGAGSWWKCSMPGRGDGPDMTKRWPACTAFTPKEP